MPKALGLIAEALEQLKEFGLITEAPAAVRARISAAATLQDCVKDADYVQENIAEKVDVKRRLYAQMDAAAPPRCILASSTSTIPTSVFSEGVPGRHRCIVAHPVNPPHLVPDRGDLTGAVDLARGRDAHARAAREGRPGADSREEGGRRASS